MKFTGPLDASTLTRIEQCDFKLTDPARLAALRRTGLMGSPREQAFDRLAQLAARVLNVPLTIVSLVGEKSQFFKAGYGLPPPYDESREIPIDTSICRYTLQGEPIIVADASTDPLLKNHPTTKPWGIVAFVAIPMITPEGHVLGAFCAVDQKPRAWSEEDLFVLRELTASVMTEIALRIQVEELESEREMREHFVHSLTHDLRTPLTAAKLNAQLLGRRLADSNLIKFSERIGESVDRADRMIRDLLDVSRIKVRESYPLDVKPGEMRGLLKNTLDELNHVHGRRFHLVPGEPVAGAWSENEIKRVVENLCQNALKYGAKDAPVTVALKADAPWLEISVHNEGTAIPFDEQAKLFDSFRRSPSALSGNQGGWGLGLALVKVIAEAHGGQATVESKPGAGTTFRVRLPIQSLSKKAT